ncbi:PRTRC system protein C [Cupriavidus consociatus]|uniref:PRTRC system protein C n=1 Tax=Cupriavidus consociatus TaxID=2821357 RepID=UPI001AE33B50|nr:MULTISPECIES: PRTRC system protein C [unclassified Cupriavidus]MBP0624775.1 PRTRC system protein C [Cupriavidus sp. LEh25]MDK2661497.1 PRTRC system protein C [Cupriavidus sp. LEh21]
MALEVKKLTREFSYNGMNLMDPGPQFTPQQVRDVYSAQYPELTTAAVDGPEHKGDVARYTFVRAAGAKGADA